MRMPTTTAVLERLPSAGRYGNRVLEWTLERLRALEGARHPFRAPGRMFATLGSFVFEVTGSLTELEGSEEYEYAEHKAIEGKPRLQYIGDALQEATLGFTLHVDFCDPAGSLAQLRALGQRHEAVPLAWANGSVEGVFVVTGIRWQIHETDTEGRALRITGRVSLLEWVDPPGGEDAAPGGEAVGPGALSRARQPDVSRPASTNPRTVSVSQILRRPG